jgi:hypothetical protein
VILHQGRLRVRGVADQPLDLSAIDGEAVVVLGDPGRRTVKQLAARLGDAPMRILAPSPARSAWQGAHGLLARATAVGVALTPRPDGL